MTTKSMMEHFNEICENCESLMMPIGEPEGISFECMECKDLGVSVSSKGTPAAAASENTQTPTQQRPSLSTNGHLLQGIKDDLEEIYQMTKNGSIEFILESTLDLVHELGLRDSFQEVINRND